MPQANQADNGTRHPILSLEMMDIDMGLRRRPVQDPLDFDTGLASVEQS
jgi:hypothetical protein